jgi:hypothetical protein
VLAEGLWPTEKWVREAKVDRPTWFGLRLHEGEGGKTVAYRANSVCNPEGDQRWRRPGGKGGCIPSKLSMQPKGTSGGVGVQGDEERGGKAADGLLKSRRSAKFGKTRADRQPPLSNQTSASNSISASPCAEPTQRFVYRVYSEYKTPRHRGSPTTTR